MGITFEGKTTNTCAPADKPKTTQLFSIQEILWDAASSAKGKGVAQTRSSTDEAPDQSPVNPKTLSVTGETSHDFLFAIKWPNVNYPPSLPPGKSLVHTEYVLRAFIQLSNGERITSEPLYAEFRPHVDPSTLTQTQTLGRRESIVKDEEGKVIAEASLTCTNEEGITFGSDCSFNLNLLIRQSESKPLPRRAKIEICEVHKCASDGREHAFILSQETINLPSILKPHKETSIPLKVKIPIPEVDDTRKGATGLPTLNIPPLQVEYMIKVTVILSSSWMSLPGKREKSVTADCPVVVGNVKPKFPKPSRNIPRLVVNVAEGEDSRDDQGISTSRDKDNERKKIVEWSPECEIPRFLGDGEVVEELI